jgi:hypothetical protein
MSTLFRFRPVGMTRAKYDQVDQKLREAGNWPPAGLQLHVLYGEEGNLMVSEIWESEEQQRAFSEQHLRPTLEEAGVQLSGPPEMLPVQVMEQG